MTVWNRFWSWLRAVLQRTRMESEMDAELRFHIEAFAEDLVRSGVSRAEAQRRARLEFGGIERAKEECRDARGTNLIESLLQDLRFGFRMLRKSPGFTAVVVLTLALGIGANTAIFSLIDAVLLSSLPVRNPEQLVLLQWHAHRSPRYDQYSSFSDCQSGGNGKDNAWGCSFSSPMFDAIRAQASVFDGVLAFAGPTNLNLSENGPASVVNAEVVSGNFFDVLGVRAEVGRTIEPADDALDAPTVVVLSHPYWQAAFGGSPLAVGHTIRLNGVPFTIVGVAQAGFTTLSPGKTQDLWLARSLFPRVGSDKGWSRIAEPANAWLTIVARLKAGTPPPQAQAAVSLIFRNELLDGSKPLLDAKEDPSVTILPAQVGLVGRRDEFQSALFVLMLAVGLILLITCANIAGLLLSRATARSREMAVRYALGAARERIARQLLTESVLLSVVGGLLGVLVAYWGVHLIVALLASGSSSPFPFKVAPDLRVLIFTASVSIVAGIVFGIAPALRSTRVDLTPALKDRSGQAAHWRLTRVHLFSMGDALVVAQVSLAVVVLAGAGLFVRTLRNLEGLNPGFDFRNVLLFAVDPPLSGYDSAQTQRLYPDLRAQIAALPGVTSVGYSQDALLTEGLGTGTITIEGDPDNLEREVDILPTGPGFFETLRIQVLSGRVFNSSDFVEVQPTQSPGLSSRQNVLGLPPSGSVPVPVVINHAFLQRYLSTRSPLGVHLKKGNSDSSSGDLTRGKPKSRTWEIVGVVADAKYSSLRREIRPTVYHPIRDGGAYFELRTAVTPAALIPEVRSIVARTDSDLPLFHISTESEEIYRELYQERLIARLSSFFGLLALLLACLGVYGLLSYEVTERTREIGIRMALGAPPRRLLRFVVGQGVALSMMGMVIGLVTALGVTRYFRSLLYGVQPTDPLTLVTVSALLVLVTLAASYVPARRATKVDPMVALRYE
jgi:predicted permease